MYKKKLLIAVRFPCIKRFEDMAVLHEVYRNDTIVCTIRYLLIFNQPSRKGANLNEKKNDAHNSTRR